jgi:hypothetical protein
MDEYSPIIEWEPDCQGKWDYDGRILSVDTRYWPGPDGGGAMTFDTSTGVFGSLPYGPKPSAKSSIILNAAKNGDDYPGYHTWREKEFEADTEAEVKAQVEAWVNEQFNDIVSILLENGKLVTGW